MTEQDKVTVDDIIGIVKTEEQTNSVDEVRKLRGRGNETAKRLFVGRKKCEDRFTIIDDYDGEIGVKENRSGEVLVLKHSDLNAQQFVAQLVVFLNDQNQAIVDLYDGSEYWSDKATEKIKELEKENEQLKKEISIFEGEDAGHYQRWVAQIKKYVDESNPNFEYDEDFIIKIALSYTLQSLRNGESLKRFQWGYKELEE